MMVSNGNNLKKVCIKTQSSWGLARPVLQTSCGIHNLLVMAGLQPCGFCFLKMKQGSLHHSYLSSPNAPEMWACRLHTHLCICCGVWVGVFLRFLRLATSSDNV